MLPLPAPTCHPQPQKFPIPKPLCVGFRQIPSSPMSFICRACHTPIPTAPSTKYKHPTCSLILGNCVETLLHMSCSHVDTDPPANCLAQTSEKKFRSVLTPPPTKICQCVPRWGLIGGKTCVQYCRAQLGHSKALNAEKSRTQSADRMPQKTSAPSFSKC